METQKERYGKMDEKKVRDAIELIKSKIRILEKLENYGSAIEERKKKHIGLYNTAIEALEKQLPKKVNYEGAFINNGFTRYRMAKCPCCEKWYNSIDENNYCSGCGQKLDWSEEDE